MKAIAIIAEFNPFHNGHEYIINTAKELSSADCCIVIMSGDFVQRGAPAITDKFTRAKAALLCGADMVLELPIYYSLGSAEYFAAGAVSILDRLGCVDSLYFGCEYPNLSTLEKISEIISNETDSYRDTLAKELKKGNSFAAAREKAVLSCSESCTDDEKKTISQILSAPNSILAIEYIRALTKINSSIKPVAIKRMGSDYASDELCETASASAIRKYINKNCAAPDFESTLRRMMPEPSVLELLSSKLTSDNSAELSSLLHYRLLLEKEKGYAEYLDVSDDFSNKILSSLDDYSDYESFCQRLKSKDIAYSRVSRALLHILLGIKKSNMLEYKDDGFTGYARVLGMKKNAALLAKEINENGNISLFTNLKNADKILTDLEMRLLNETLTASRIYRLLSSAESISEYRQKPIIL